MPTYLIPKGKALISFYQGAESVEMHLVTQEAFHSKRFRSFDEAVSFAGKESALLDAEEMRSLLFGGAQNWKWSKLVPPPDSETMQIWGFNI